MKLRQYLTAHNVSVQAFADAIQVSVQAVHRYIVGERMPRPEVMERVKHATEGAVQPNDFAEAVAAFQSARASGCAVDSLPAAPMSTALRNPGMTRAQFFAWAEADGGRWEFDGFEPVAMTGGTINHSRIMRNLHAALGARLQGSGCEPLGPDAGVATVGDAVRYPDALVTCAKAPGDAYVVPGVVVVFEVLSPTSGRIDRIVKLREYQAVPSIRRYVILEHASIGLTVLTRANADENWTATALTAEDTLRMPEIGVEIPVSEFYASVELPASPDG